ncbi:hypothetical protein GTY65_28020 [Streptomyces sp. SID8379]|uniref:hypothetical protein n=1 Tax=unclassified Streptomyces TaxID=2593676 RepID=UPI00131A2619|nr:MULTISPECIES: hypothetical protein [unclassified Streptomyces]MYW67893.1 hypothetical protein [Streptomyces sp. SID8379]
MPCPSEVTHRTLTGSDIRVTTRSPATPWAEHHWPGSSSGPDITPHAYAPNATDPARSSTSAQVPPPGGQPLPGTRARARRTSAAAAPRATNGVTIGAKSTAR